MDHAHAWRSRPPMPPPPPFAAPPPVANICPVCSCQHFPFCPSPYSQTPGMPFHDQYYPRPPLPPLPAPPALPPLPPLPLQPQPPPPQAPYDPFVDHQPGTTMNPPRPWTGNTNSNPSFDRDLYGYANTSFDYAHAGSKRMRVDESVPGPGLSWGPNMDASQRGLTDDERRLKLIREHGGTNHEFGKHLEGFGGARNETGFEAKSSNNFDTGNFRDPSYGSFDRKETVYSQESHYNSKKFSEDRLGQQYVHSDRNIELKRMKYDQSNGYGYSGNPADGYNKIEVNRRSSEGSGYSSSMRDGYVGDWQGVSGANAGYNDSRSDFGMENHEFRYPYSQSYRMQQHGMDLKPIHYGSPYVNEQGDGGAGSRDQSQNYWVFNGQPPLPASPPPPLPVEPPGRLFREPVVSTSPPGTSLFPVAVASSAPAVSSYPSVPESNSSPATYYFNKAQHASSGFRSEGIQTIQQAAAKTYLGESEKFPLSHRSLDKPKVLDASHLLKHPHRTSRPDHIVIILRGLPGSGKSYLAKMLRDLEVENGGSAPRIHTMDDYFMTEVEKVEESEGSKPSGSARVKKAVTKKVMEYCYEPEMEEAYRSSLLKAFKKTLDEGVFSFVIVDDRNLRVADFAQFWATAKRSGYEVYLLEATYKDPAGCAARNIHGFTQDDIQKMSDKWEEAPSLYLKLDIKSLLHGDNLEESGIQEVDMDTEDGDVIGVSSSLYDTNPEMVKEPLVQDLSSNGPSDDQRWDTKADRQIEEVKELGKSKWSSDLDEDHIHKTGGRDRKLNSLSGLIQSYSKDGKTVRWGDKVGNKGFSIGAAKSARASSLIIGPGPGYNSKTNPLTEEDKLASKQNTGEPKGQNVFQQQLRAEHESFRAAFDKRRHRIGRLEVDDES